MRGRVKNSLMEWTIAVVLALSLNFLLLAMMPGLIRQDSDMAGNNPIEKASRTVRVRTLEPRPPQDKPRPLPKPKPENQVKPIGPANVIPRSVQTAPPNPNLDIDLNPDLPATSMDLALSVLQGPKLALPSEKSIYDIGELDMGLTPLVKIPPVYPFRAKRRGIEGEVTVGFTVTARGEVRDIRILSANPPEIFDRAVQNCVNAWKFKPPTVDGVPVETRARTTIRFELEDE